MRSMEIEVKAKCPEGITEKLKHLGARYVRTVEEKNTIYNSNSRNFAETGELVRVREESGKHILCYKKRAAEGVLQKYEETESIVDKNIYEILPKIDLFVDIAYEKKRDYWEFGGIEIVVDEIPELGKFVELELKSGDEQRLFETAEKLGIPRTELLEKTYPALLREKLKSQEGV